MPVAGNRAHMSIPEAAYLLLFTTQDIAFRVLPTDPQHLNNALGDGWGCVSVCCDDVFDGIVRVVCYVACFPSDSTWPTLKHVSGVLHQYVGISAHRFHSETFIQHTCPCAGFTAKVRHERNSSRAVHPWAVVQNV